MFPEVHGHGDGGEKGGGGSRSVLAWLVGRVALFFYFFKEIGLQ